MTEKISSVIVKAKNGIFYQCRPTDKYHIFKCGKCGRGNVKAEERSLCRVCGSRVAQVLKISEAYLPVWPVTFAN